MVRLVRWTSSISSDGAVCVIDLIDHDQWERSLLLVWDWSPESINMRINDVYHYCLIKLYTPSRSGRRSPAPWQRHAQSAELSGSCDLSNNKDGGAKHRVLHPRPRGGDGGTGAGTRTGFVSRSGSSSVQRSRKCQAAGEWTSGSELLLVPVDQLIRMWWYQLRI